MGVLSGPIYAAPTVEKYYLIFSSMEGLWSQLWSTLLGVCEEIFDQSVIADKFSCLREKKEMKD